jgi:hypothetical protein
LLFRQLVENISAQYGCIQSQIIGLGPHHDDDDDDDDDDGDDDDDDDDGGDDDDADSVVVTYFNYCGL